MYDMGARLQALRKAKGWSQEALGRKVNKAKSVISGYESNLRTPPLDVLTSLARCTASRWTTWPASTSGRCCPSRA